MTDEAIACPMARGECVICTRLLYTKHYNSCMVEGVRTPPTELPRMFTLHDGLRLVRRVR